MSENYRRYDVIIDKLVGLVAERLQGRQAAGADRGALVAEAIAHGIIGEDQRDTTMRLLQSAPEEMIQYLDGLGMAEVRQAAELFGWETPAETRRYSDAEQEERQELAAMLGCKPEEVI